MLNVLSLFSGIGAFEKALDNLKIEYNLLAYCEIDKHASKSYSIIHNVSEDKNLNDVTKVDFLDIDEQPDLITYGFPCQDISNAGKQKGFTDEEGNRTRSGLFFEALRIIEEFKPKFAIAENVKALTSKKFTNEFNVVLDSLDQAGYNNYYQVLNAKDYGVQTCILNQCEVIGSIYDLKVVKEIILTTTYFSNSIELERAIELVNKGGI